MDQEYNEKIRPYLDLADKLSYLLKDTQIKIPKIASCGMQSHGKSSTLESITHISLPKGDGTVTVCPIKIQLRNTKEKEYARIKFEKESEDDFQEINLDEISDKIMEYQDEVKRKNGIKENEIKLFDELIQVEVNRKNAPNLTLIDLPGLNFDPKIQSQSEKINEKYLQEEETTVLLVLKGGEEITNSFATKFMLKIKNYQNRFNAIVTNSDNLKDRDIKKYISQLKNLKLNNPISFVVNKSKNTQDLTYEQMQIEEKKIINNIPNISDYKNINKGIEELIKLLIKIQAKEITKLFSEIESNINDEIYNLEDKIANLGKEIETPEEFSNELEKKIREFNKNINIRSKNSEYDYNGKLIKNSMKNQIAIEIKKQIEECKLQISNIFDESFCRKIANEILQYDSDEYNVFDEDIFISNLLKPKIEQFLTNFKYTTQKITNYMVGEVYLLINETFGKYENMEVKVKNLYKKYFEEKKNQLNDYFKKIIYLEYDNIKNYNIDLLTKSNTMEKNKVDFFNKNDYIKKEINKEVKNAKKEEDLKDVKENENSNYFADKIKIEKDLKEKSTSDEKIIYDVFDKELESRKKNKVFIPDFQNIQKKKLEDFRKLIKDEKINFKTANIIVKMATYMEILFNKVLNPFYLNIWEYLYDKFLGEDMINYIRNSIQSLPFEERKELFEDEDTNEWRQQLKTELKSIKLCLEEINNLKKKMKA